MTTPRKLTLNEQLEEKNRLEREQKDSGVKPEKPIEVKSVREPTPQELLQETELQIKKLRAEQELKSIQTGYKNYLDAVTQLENDKKIWTQKIAEYPDLLTKEDSLNKQIEQVNLSKAIADRYSRDKHTEGDIYLKAKKSEGDQYVLSSREVWQRESAEEIRQLNELRDEVSAKIDIYKEAVEPFTKIMIKDATIVYLYLQDCIYPILESGAVRLLGGFNQNKISSLTQQARLAHDSLMQDAVNMANTSERIRGRL